MGQNPTKQVETAIFAGGCFWCLESAFDDISGIENVVSGYIGGGAETANYEAVSSGTTGHVEAVKLTFDPLEISYWDLLGIFFRQIDPTDAGGSFVDRGTQYKSVIFFTRPEQERLARAMISRLNTSKIFDRPIATEVAQATAFYPAEEVHQDYHRKNPVRYRFYRTGSGRERFIHSFWEAGKKEVFKNPPPEP